MARLPTRKQAGTLARSMMDHHDRAAPDGDGDEPRMGGGRVPGVATGTPQLAPGFGKPMPKRAPGKRKG